MDVDGMRGFLAYSNVYTVYLYNTSQISKTNPWVSETLQPHHESLGTSGVMAAMADGLELVISSDRKEPNTPRCSETLQSISDFWTACSRQE